MSESTTELVSPKEVESQLGGTQGLSRSAQAGGGIGLVQSSGNRALSSAYAGAGSVGGEIEDEREDEEERRRLLPMIVPPRQDSPRPEEAEIIDERDKNGAPLSEKRAQGKRSKATSTLTEGQVPFHLYSGWDWNHLGGGEGSKSSRTSIARRSTYDQQAGKGPSAGIDFLVENVKTGRLVIGEQKAWASSSEFRDATAITVHLGKNVTQAIETLRGSIERGDVHPDAVPHLNETIARLEATRTALENKTALPDGVVFELTSVGGKGSEIGTNHIELLEKKFGGKPSFLEHLLGRTFVRNPQLARAQGRATTGQTGTDADPDIIPAAELLTDGARDTLERVRQGKNKKEWKKQKTADRKAQALRAKADRKADRKATARQEEAAKAMAIAQADKLARKVTREKLAQLKAERARSGEPRPSTKKARATALSGLKRQALAAGKQARRESLDAFDKQRKKQRAAETAQRKADAAADKVAWAQQRDLARQEADRSKAAEKNAAEERKTARAQAEAEQGLPVGQTPESTQRLKAEIESRNRTAQRNASLRNQATQVANQAAGGVRAWDAYQDALGAGKSQVEALGAGVKTYLENTNPVFGAIASAEAKQRDGQDPIEAWLATVGETGAGLVYPGSAPDQAINAFANVIGAADDHFNRGRSANDPAARQASLRTGTDLAADLTPSRVLAQTAGGGLRAYYGIVKAAQGDLSRVEKFGDDALAGKLGSVFVFPAMVADFERNLDSSDAATAIAKTVQKSEGSLTTQIGYASGDALYEFGQNAEAKSGAQGLPVQGLSQSVGMVSDMIAGDSFEKAAEKAAAAGKGSLADKIGSASADALYELGQDSAARSGEKGAALQGLSQLVGVASDLAAGDSFETALSKAAAAGKGSLADTVGSALGDAMFTAAEKTQALFNEDN